MFAVIAKAGRATACPLCGRLEIQITRNPFAMGPTPSSRSSTAQVARLDLREASATAREEKTYHGRREAGGSCTVWVVDEPLELLEAEAVSESARRELPLRLDLHGHSPTGFQWGYGGSGPAHLALAMLADALGDDEVALDHYQEFKRAHIERFENEWTCTAEKIRHFVAQRQDAPAQS